LSTVCHRRTTCRLCGGPNLKKVLALGQTPLANAFVPGEALNRVQPVFPLDVYLCRNCAHAQLLDVVDASVLYKDYVYVSGTSPVFVQHFKDYARQIVERFAPPANALVVEIGSNDGTLLHCFKEHGLRVLGVDPAEEITRKTVASGIDAILGFFTPALAREIRSVRGPASVIAANNVMAHIDDLTGVMDGIRHLLAPDGVFVFEVSYLVDVVEKTLFDTIYHEHLDYHTVKPLIGFFQRCGLELIGVARVDTHGGSLRGLVQLAGGPRQVDPSVGLHGPEAFLRLARQIEGVKSELVGLLRRVTQEGKRIAGFGAPAKATTLMYSLGIEPGMIEFIVDDSPLKQGLYTPGMHIPVLPARALYDKRPDYLVVLAWNFAQAIMRKHGAFREGGGRFVIPLPKVEVI
jgi:SAM-dependent methyltransferase